MKDQRWYENFSDKHGSAVLDGPWLLYQDGARQEASGLGVMHLPPDDPTELRRLAIRFWSIKTALASEQFRLTKDEYERSIANKIAPSRDQINNLKGLQRKVSDYQSQLDELMQVENTEEEETHQQALDVYERWQKIRAKLQRVKDKLQQAHVAGDSRLISKYSTEALTLRVQSNELGRQWRSVPGVIRHRITMDERTLRAERLADELESIEI